MFMDISLQLSVLLWISICISLDFYGYPCIDLLWILYTGVNFRVGVREVAHLFTPINSVSNIYLYRWILNVKTYATQPVVFSNERVKRYENFVTRKSSLINRTSILGSPKSVVCSITSKRLKSG